MSRLARINARISVSMNDWLDEESEETGLSKSAIVSLALEQYRLQKQNMDQLSQLNVMLKEMQNTKVK